ncbi:hypothetical protein [Companilactobacillus sp. HBUAS59699]|uniref:hypothetical protein n=1 Tax=Companilactobacillus sp. HBUAS59699 TaxID=3109358 RepID=UPI002FF327A0
MKKRHAMIHIGVWLMFLMGLFFVGSKTNEVEAAPTKDAVFMGAPEGMTGIKDYFNIPGSYTIGEKVSNSAQILEKGDTVNTDIVQMTNGVENLSSIWGKMSSDNKEYNYFDISKKQTFSMWLYFGDKNFNYNKYNEDKNDIDSNNGSGEGMAFVIQNDDKGDDAISFYKGGLVSLLNPKTPIGFESLGIWGGTISPNSILSSSISSASEFKNGAIQNSFALEFDTQRNVSSGKDDVFDATLEKGSKQAKGQHIAWNYPASESTYQKNGSYFNMQHKDVIPNLDMSGDGSVSEAWKHFTFIYYPPENGNKPHISYSFDDKEYDGSIKPFNEWNIRGDGIKHDNIELDLSEFNLKSGQTKLRWGLTSSTGSTITNNAVIFESIPAVADVNATTNLYDYTQERDIPDSDKDSTVDDNVNNGDKLRFDYNLTYNSGFEYTGDIKTQINVPENVDFTADEDGNIGEIAYSETDIEKINASALNADGTINLTLRSMGSDNASVQVRLNGTANIGSNASAEKTAVLPAHTSYDSTHYTGDVMTPKFHINPLTDTLRLAPKDPDDDMTRTIKTGKEAVMDMNIKYQNGSTFGNNKVTVTTIVDGEKSVSDYTVDPSAADSDYSLVLSGLSVKSHDVEVYVTDSMHRISDHLKYTVNVEDKKLLLDVDNEREITMSSDDVLHITGSISHDDGSNFVGGLSRIAYYINGELRLYDMTKIDDDDKSIYEFKYDWNGSVFKEGDNELKIIAQDVDNLGNIVRESEPVTIKVYITNKLLQLTSDKNYKFQASNQSNESKILKRADKWTLDVTSAKTSWILTARSDGLMGSNGIPLSGDMIYRKDGNEYTLADDPVEIDRDGTVSTDKEITHIADEWLPTEGVLLKIQPNVSAGTYTGEIEWTLVDGLM